MAHTKQDYIPILKTSTLFASLTDEEITEIARKMYYCEFDKGNALVYEGEMGNELYIVVEGEVTVSVVGKTEKKSGAKKSIDDEPEVIILAKITEGDFFGEMSMLERQPRSATCSAATDVKALVLKSKDFLGLITTGPQVAGKILANMLHITSSRLTAVSSFATQVIQWGIGAKRRAITDKLTGLFNRRYLDTYMESLLVGSITEGKKVSFAMVDIDHFGQLNQKYGAAFCDTLLKAITDVFKTCFDEDDILVRYGGDEFCFFIRGEWERAAQQCQNVCDGLNRLHFPEHPDLVPSCSIGLAQYTTGLTATVLSKRADTELYKAKEGGRNRVSVMQCNESN